MELNTREIATLIWLGIIAVAIFLMPGMRESLAHLWKAFTQWRLLFVLALTLGYIGLTIWFLYAICVWDWDQAKNTTVWTFSVALVAVFTSNKIPDQPGYFRRWITQNFQILAFVEFMVTLYTYPLLVELAVIPVTTFVGGMIAVGKYDPKAKQAVSLLTNLLAVFTLGFFGYALYMTFMDLTTYATVQTWRDLYTPILLTLAFLPFIFVLHVFMSYETAFVSLDFAFRDKRVGRAAKWRSVVAFGPRVRLMRRWLKHVQRHRPQTMDELKASFRDVKEAQQREDAKTPVDSAQGWSPGIAKDYLADFGLPTGDYHQSFADEWFASSPILEIGDDIIPNNIAYYVEGTAVAATILKLKLNINAPANPVAAEARFKEFAAILIEAATGISGAQIDLAQPIMAVGKYAARVTRTGWTGGIKGGYDYILTLSPVP